VTKETNGKGIDGQRQSYIIDKLQFKGSKGHDCGGGGGKKKEVAEETRESRGKQGEGYGRLQQL